MAILSPTLSDSAYSSWKKTYLDLKSSTGINTIYVHAIMDAGCASPYSSACKFTFYKNNDMQKAEINPCIVPNVMVKIML